MSDQLGEELRKIRRIRGVSLRKVEEETKISNAYLSQLENGKAENPSPHILHKLAAYYGVPYESLMDAAGYLQPPSKLRPQKRLSAIQAALFSADLDKEEQKEVADFIGFLRSRARPRSK